MPTNYTSNYNLSQWERSDKVLMEDFNADNAKIDTALAALSAADRSEAQARKSLEATVNKKGNCRLWTTTYVGDGTQSRSITFPSRPVVVFVMGENIFMRLIYGAPIAMCSNSGDGGAACPVIWEGNTLTWKYSLNTSFMCNLKGETHYVAALIDLDD